MAELGGTTGPGAPGHDGSGPVPAVYFLSDYGTVDEFAGVVHAVLHRLVPTLSVIDLSHQVPAFDVAAGAALLVRSGPFLGAGVVLAVVDPGVGTDRRGVALEVPPGGPQWLVGPDNGLLLPLAASLGGVLAAVAIDRQRVGTVPGGFTFDGRDVFAPVAAHLVAGGDAEQIGDPIDTATLAAVPARGAEGEGGRSVDGSRGPTADGPGVRAGVTWIDGFGNVQLATAPDDLSAVGVTLGATAQVTVLSGHLRGAGRGGDGGEREGEPEGGGGQGGPVVARRVRAFAELTGGEFGLLEDANGQVSLVLDRESAARALEIPGTGAIVLIGAETTGGARRSGGHDA